MVLSGVAIQLPWLQSCSTDPDDLNESLPNDISPFTSEEFKTIRAFQRVLFPDDGNGPGAKQINAEKYLCWAFRDPYMDKTEIENYKKRINQLMTTCKAETGNEFIHLSTGDRHDFVESLSKKDWGEKFISRNLTLIFEALLLDPVYGGNTNRAGWEWLSHNPGTPRPNENNVYPQIMKRYEL